MADQPKHPGGAPTKYDPAYCEQMIKFFSVTPTLDEVIAKKTQNGLIEFPTFEKFAASLAVSTRSLQNWADEYPEFFRTYEQCKEMQKAFLIQAGLNDLYNSGFAKFVAINCTDMRDKQDVEHSGGIQVSRIELPAKKPIGAEVSY